MNETLSVGELGVVVRAALQQGLPYGVWVHGEIRSIHRSRNGHVYFDLIETQSDTPGAAPVAVVAVALFREQRERVNATLLHHGNPIRMSDGVRIRLSGMVDFYPPSGRLQIRMTAIDPTFTLGVIAAERDALLRELAATGLLRANAARPLAEVPLRVGLVTSLNSAAHADIVTVFEDSEMAFVLVEVDTPVQGVGAEHSIGAAVRAAAAADVDLVLLARGGGSKTDLAVFDHAVVAKAIATVEVPVFCGIGHDIDHCVADDVAHTSATTPTAAASTVVAIVDGWHNRLITHQRTLAHVGRQALASAEHRLNNGTRRAVAATRTQMIRAEGHLDACTRRLGRAVNRVELRAEAQLERATARIEISQRHILRSAQARTDATEARMQALDPALALARGWSITRGPTGSVVRSVAEVGAGVELRTRLIDGELVSTITAVEAADV